MQSTRPQRTSLISTPTRGRKSASGSAKRPMLLRTFRFIALVLGALALTMESAQVLELAQKLQYSAEMYAAVNSTLYRYFAIVGSAYQIGAVLAAGLLAFFLRRHRRVYRWTLAGAVLLLLAFVAWCSV